MIFFVSTFIYRRTNDLSSISLLTFTMEGESELRASDAFIAKWLITSEFFSLSVVVAKF